MDEEPDIEPTAAVPVEHVVATLRLPFSVEPLAEIVQRLVDEYDDTLRMRYDGEFAVFYRPGGLP